MLNSFLIGCNARNVDLRLNSLEVLTVLLGQTEVWLKVPENLSKIIDCFCTLSQEFGQNPEFAEPLVIGLKHILQAQEKGAKLCISSSTNPKSALLNLVKKNDPEL